MWGWLQCALRKALGWNYMTAGNNLARMVDTIWTQAGIKEFGLPPSNHWQRAAVCPGSYSPMPALAYGHMMHAVSVTKSHSYASFRRLNMAECICICYAGVPLVSYALSTLLLVYTG